MYTYICRLNQTQKYIMEIVKPVLSIADQLGVTCWMQGGTMLGAIRHKGFIPWDDDIDIGIMREDYDKFINEVEKHLPEYMELRTYWDKSDHHYYFARIVDTRHQIKRMGSAEIRYEDVWVDIFPLDGMPNNICARFFHKINLSWKRLLYHLSCIEKVNKKRPGRPVMEKIIIQIALLVRPVLRLDTVKRLNAIDVCLRRFPPKQSNWIINFMGQTSFRFNEMISKEIYGRGNLYSFEDISMYGPEDYNAYLECLYGDYMKPPKDRDKDAHVSELVK